jgi:hypothetical protein
MLQSMTLLLIALLACTSPPTSGTGGSTGTDVPSVGDDDDDAPTGDDDDDLPTGDDDDDDDVTGPTGTVTDTSGTPTDTSGTTDTGCADDDGDGVDACSGDCDDADPLIFPGADERCNGLDDDCDGAPLDDEIDSNGDGTYECAACDDAGFWLATRTLSGSALADAVTDAVAAQTCADYSDARSFLFGTLDNVGGNVECVYTGRVQGGVSATWTDWDNLNTEHTWPQSLGAGSEPAKCDLHHLFPTDAVTNSTRGSNPFGEVVNDTQSISGGSRMGTDASGDTVFEPRDQHKGNVARAMVYFAHRYGHPLSGDELALYKAWHQLDPVDATELDRTFAIAEEQELANPYVTCPDLLPAL